MAAVETLVVEVQSAMTGASVGTTVTTNLSWTVLSESERTTVELQFMLSSKKNWWLKESTTWTCSQTDKMIEKSWNPQCRKAASAKWIRSSSCINLEVVFNKCNTFMVGPTFAFCVQKKRSKICCTVSWNWNNQTNILQSNSKDFLSKAWFLMPNIVLRNLGVAGRQLHVAMLSRWRMSVPLHVFPLCN